MTAAAWIQMGVLVVAIAVITPLLGAYLAKVFGDGPAPGDRVLGVLDRAVYRVGGIDPEREQRWTTYAISLGAFSIVSLLVLWAIESLQAVLPVNPTNAPAMPPLLGFNTAASFVTNTNWQSLVPEQAVSHLTQMIGYTVQNFGSAAVGIAVAVALVRGLTRRRSETIGNFWVDLTRAITRVLLPIAFVAAIVMVSQGVVQNLTGHSVAHTVNGAIQHIPGGPVASQEAIKEFGTNGGGFFNANSAHPFENPTGFTNILQLVLMLAIPFALTSMFGRLAGNRRQGWVIFAAMLVLWAGSAVALQVAETSGNHRLPATIDQTASATQSGGNMEGKETRFGPAGSALYGASTTGTSNGAVVSSHDSFTPAGGGVALVNMMLGEVSPGGVGSGLYGMLVFVLLAVFIAGLMVGRTPEFLGKKIQAAEMRLVVLYILAVPFAVLVLLGASLLIPSARDAALNHGPHRLTEIAYAYTSAANNNGSAFAGLSANTAWYNSTLAVAMLIGRYALIVPVLAIAGLMARKQPSPPSAGTFPTDSTLFAGLLVGVIMIVVGLTFFPVLALGPLAEGLAR